MYHDEIANRSNGIRTIPLPALASHCVFKTKKKRKKLSILTQTNKQISSVNIL